jgi:starvation-inducible DNA-binding protein
MSINIGIAEDQRNQICAGLSTLLADSYRLYLKTHGFHWNVTGPHFAELHTLFEKQYLEMAIAVDDIAERIRALGHFAPASFKQFHDQTSIPQETGVPNFKEMIKQLTEGQEIVIKTCRHILPICEGADDVSTADLITRRLLEHEKNAWMLRSLLEK